MPTLSAVMAPSSTARFTPPKPTLTYLGSGTSNLGKFQITNYDSGLTYSHSGATLVGDTITVTSATAAVTVTAAVPKGLAVSNSIVAERKAPSTYPQYIQTGPYQCYNDGSCASQCGGCGTYYEPGNPTWGGVGGYWTCCDQGYYIYPYSSFSGSGYTWSGADYTNGSGEWWKIT